MTTKSRNSIIVVFVLALVAFLAWFGQGTEEEVDADDDDSAAVVAPADDDDSGDDDDSAK